LAFLVFLVICIIQIISIPASVPGLISGGSYAGLLEMRIPLILAYADLTKLKRRKKLRENNLGG